RKTADVRHYEGAAHEPASAARVPGSSSARTRWHTVEGRGGATGRCIRPFRRGPRVFLPPRSSSASKREPTLIASRQILTGTPNGRPLRTSWQTLSYRFVNAVYRFVPRTAGCE